MKLLLDTHALLFWLYEPARLGSSALRKLSDRDNRVYWSVASSWELAIKVGLGKLRLDGPVERVIPAELLRNGFSLLPIEHHHVLVVATLPPIHGDPFDRLLIAQGQAEGLTLVSADAKVTAYGVPVLW
ncbi:MAG TPA: type II toxin-antitoxin system VapC family toxin [Myxococcota bacterium]|nr:type II toxin-antitoxin system VapC family toxin [Myxococcota bacterium]